MIKRNVVWSGKSDRLTPYEISYLQYWLDVMLSDENCYLIIMWKGYLHDWLLFTGMVCGRSIKCCKYRFRFILICPMSSRDLLYRGSVW